MNQIQQYYENLASLTERINPTSVIDALAPYSAETRTEYVMPATKILQRLFEENGKSLAEQITFIENTPDLKQFLLQVPFQEYVFFLPQIMHFLLPQQILTLQINQLCDEATSIFTQCLYILKFYEGKECNQEKDEFRDVLNVIDKRQQKMNVNSNAQIFAQLVLLFVNYKFGVQKFQIKLFAFLTSSSKALEDSIIYLNTQYKLCSEIYQFVAQCPNSILQQLYPTLHQLMVRNMAKFQEFIVNQDQFKKIQQYLQFSQLLDIFKLEFNPVVMWNIKDKLTEEYILKHLVKLSDQLVRLDNETFVRLVSQFTKQQIRNFLLNLLFKQKYFENGMEMQKQYDYSQQHNFYKANGLIKKKIVEEKSDQQQQNKLSGFLQKVQFSLNKMTNNLNNQLTFCFNYSIKGNQNKFLQINFSNANSKSKEVDEIVFETDQERGLYIKIAKERQLLIDYQCFAKEVQKPYHITPIESVQVVLQIASKNTNVYINQQLKYKCKTTILTEIQSIQLCNAVIGNMYITQQLLSIQSLFYLQFCGIQYIQQPVFDFQVCNLLCTQQFNNCGFAINQTSLNDVTLTNAYPLSVVNYTNVSNKEGDTILMDELSGKLKAEYYDQTGYQILQQHTYKEQFNDEIMRMICYHGMCAINYQELLVIYIAKQTVDQEVCLCKQIFITTYSSEIYQNQKNCEKQVTQLLKNNAIQNVSFANSDNLLVQDNNKLINLIKEYKNQNQFDLNQVMQFNSDVAKQFYLSLLFICNCNDIKQQIIFIDDNDSKQLYKQNTSIFNNYFSTNFLLRQFYHNVVNQQQQNNYQIINSLINSKFITELQFLKSSQQTIYQDNSLLASLYILISNYNYSVNIDLLQLIISYYISLVNNSVMKQNIDNVLTTDEAKQCMQHIQQIIQTVLILIKFKLNINVEQQKQTSQSKATLTFYQMFKAEENINLDSVQCIIYKLHNVDNQINKFQEDQCTIALVKLYKMFENIDIEVVDPVYYFKTVFMIYDIITQFYQNNTILFQHLHYIGMLRQLKDQIFKWLNINQELAFQTLVSFENIYVNFVLLEYFVIISQTQQIDIILFTNVYKQLKAFSLSVKEKGNKMQKYNTQILENFYNILDLYFCQIPNLSNYSDMQTALLYSIIIISYQQFKLNNISQSLTLILEIHQQLMENDKVQNVMLSISNNQFYSIYNKQTDEKQHNKEEIIIINEYFHFVTHINNIMMGNKALKYFMNKQMDSQDYQKIIVFYQENYSKSKQFKQQCLLLNFQIYQTIEVKDYNHLSFIFNQVSELQQKQQIIKIHLRSLCLLLKRFIDNEMTEFIALQKQQNKQNSNDYKNIMRRQSLITDDVSNAINNEDLIVEKQESVQENVQEKEETACLKPEFEKYYSAQNDSFIQTLLQQKNKMNIFNNSYTALKTAKMELGLTSSQDNRADDASLFVYIAYKFGASKDAALIIQAYSNEFPQETASLCLKEEKIVDSDKFKASVQMCMAGEAQDFINILSHNTGIGSYVRGVVKTKLTQFNRQQNVEYDFTQKVMDKIKITHLAQVQFSQYIQQQFQAQNKQLNILLNCQKYVKQYNISILNLVRTILQKKLLRESQDEIQYSRIALRETQLRGRYHQQILVQCEQLETINKQFETFLNKNKMYQNIHLSYFLPQNVHILASCMVFRSIGSNLSNQPGIFVITTKYLFFIPMISFKEKQSTFVDSDQYNLQHQTSTYYGCSNISRLTIQQYALNTICQINAPNQDIQYKQLVTQFLSYLSDPEVEYICQDQYNLLNILNQTIIIPIQEVTCITPRQYAHRETSLEIMTKLGYSFNLDVMDIYTYNQVQKIYKIPDKFDSKQQQFRVSSLLTAEITRGIMFYVINKTFSIRINSYYFKPQIIQYVVKNFNAPVFSMIGDILLSPNLPKDEKLKDILLKNINKPIQEYMSAYRDYCTNILSDYIIKDDVIIPYLESLPQQLIPQINFSQCETLIKQYNSKNIKQALTQLMFDFYVNDIITSFQLMSYLNTLSGRTLNDLGMYPIYPIVKDRDMQLPVQAQRSDRVSTLKDRAINIREMSDPAYTLNSTYNAFNLEMFINGTFCSNSASTIYYLFRQQPYTTALIDLQSNKYDAPDRMFHSYNCLYDIIFDTNYKEHIMQLFQSIKLNLNLFNLNPGKRSCGKMVGDLDFLNGKQSMEELESKQIFNCFSLLVDYNKQLYNVDKQQLFHWLQLFFGQLQSSEERYNCYPTYSYCMKIISEETLTQEIDKIRYFGSMSEKLFDRKTKLFGSKQTQEQAVDQQVQLFNKDLQQLSLEDKQFLEQSNCMNEKMTQLNFFQGKIMINTQEYILQKVFFGKKIQLRPVKEQNSIVEDLIMLSNILYLKINQYSIQILANNQENQQLDSIYILYQNDYILDAYVYKISQNVAMLIIIGQQQIKIYNIIFQVQSMTSSINSSKYFINFNIQEIYMQNLEEENVITSSTFSQKSAILYYSYFNKITKRSIVIEYDVLNQFMLNKIEINKLFNETQNLSIRNIQVNNDDYLFLQLNYIQNEQQKTEVIILNNELIQILKLNSQQQILQNSYFVCGNSLYDKCPVLYVYQQKCVYMYQLDNFEKFNTLIQDQNDISVVVEKVNSQELEKQNLFIIGCQFEQINQEKLTDCAYSNKLYKYGDFQLKLCNEVRFTKYIKKLVVGNMGELCVQFENNSWASYFQGW